jgi:hypothetical protein
MGCHPGLVKPSPLAGPAKEFCQGGITYRLTPALAASADEKDEWTCRIERALAHDIGIYGLQRVRFVKVDHAFDSTLGPQSFGMVTTTTNDNTTPAIGHVFQV